MYVWLSLQQVKGGLALSDHGCNLDPLRAPETNAAALTLRRNAVMKIMAATHPELKGSESSRVYLALAKLVQNLPPGFSDLDFAIHLGLAHHCLPQAQRTARDSAIDAWVELYCGPPDSRSASIQPQLAVLREQMTLLPDEHFETFVSSYCGLLLSETVMEPSHPLTETRVLQAYQRMNIAISTLAANDEHKRSIGSLLSMVYCLLPPSRREELVDGVTDQRNRQALPMLLRADDGLVTLASLTPWHRARALFAILLEVGEQGLKADDPLTDDIIESHVVRTRSEIDRLYSQARDTTLVALKAGVPMGERGVATRTVLLKLRSIERRLNIRLTLKRSGPALAKPAATSPPTGITALISSTDMDPVHAWSVARLVRWIEGPLAERSTRGRLDRQSVVALERDAIEQETQEQRAVGLQAQPLPAAITEAEVGEVMNDALAATARFFHDDLVDLAPLAKSLGIQPALLTRCLELQPQLEALGRAPAAMDEENARALLQDAEASMGALRQGIRVAEAATLLVKRFSARFLAAMSVEPMVLGKRHGGVIGCPLRPADWPWVARMFHRRCLPQIGSVLIDGEPMALQSDQALALYVTGSSQSSYAFDVSVHLWQRRAGRSSPPCGRDELYPPMNDQDWFDTYIPCAVLHVPPAK